MAEIHHQMENGGNQPNEKEISSENSTESPTATSPLLKSEQGRINKCEYLCQLCLGLVHKWLSPSKCYRREHRRQQG